MMTAGWLMDALTIYAALGALFATAFVTVGVNRIDPIARGSDLGFRLMILPGSAALWPMLLTRWIRHRRAQ